MAKTKRRLSDGERARHRERSQRGAGQLLPACETRVFRVRYSRFSETLNTPASYSRIRAKPRLHGRLS
jgi:hypothetical protein